MKAKVGDRLVIKGHHVGEPDRDAEILEVHGDDGGPPFLVRWDDDGHEGLFFPGSDATVDHIAGRRTRADSMEPAAGVVGFDDEVVVAPGRLAAPGHLTVPRGAQGLVLFAHGSGSSRRSPRNRFVAERLHGAGLGTLLFDLLSEEEARDRANVFDAELRAVRLLVATRWARQDRSARGLPVGYFGASTGAGAALMAAAEDRSIGAVVSRGGRPDLAQGCLSAVYAPTLLIVGGADPAVVELNEHASRRLRCEHRLVVVPGATHLFEQPGALEAVADVAASWFTGHFGR